MYKAALILGVVALLVAAGATLISPLCAPCAGIFLGLGAGYLACAFDKPASTSLSTKAGAIAGAAGGVGAVLGQLIGTGINAAIVGPAGAAEFSRMLGLPTSGPGFEQSYWIGLASSAVCLSLLDLLVMAGFGALGAFLWRQTAGKNVAPPSGASMAGG